MALNNNILYNAAFAAAMKASLSGRLQTSAVALSYAPLVAACQAFATEVDSQIAFDASITTGSGTPTVLAMSVANTISAPQFAKPRLLENIVAGVLDGRPLTDTTAADYLALAAAVAAIYTEGLTATVIP